LTIDMLHINQWTSIQSDGPKMWQLQAVVRHFDYKPQNGTYVGSSEHSVQTQWLMITITIKWL